MNFRIIKLHQQNGDDHFLTVREFAMEIIMFANIFGGECDGTTLFAHLESPHVCQNSLPTILIIQNRLVKFMDQLKNRKKKKNPPLYQKKLQT